MSMVREVANYGAGMRRISAFIVVLSLGVSTAVIPQARAWADEPDELPNAMPVKDAIAKLGSRTDGVARAHGRSEADWKSQEKDATAWIDRKGALFFKDPVADKASTAAAATVGAAAPFPYAQTFLLHSNPTSTRKLFLDFDGYTATGTSWSSSSLVATAYSSDADLTTFTPTEQDVVQAAGVGGLRAVRHRRHHAGPGCSRNHQVGHH
jgi:hypothetical protein